MIEVADTEDGLLLPVRAQPRAKRDGIVGVHAGRLRVAVTAAPDKGQANEALITVLAAALGVKRSQITLSSGGTSRDKVFCVAGLPAAELRSRLAEWL